jgi:hypothetical protein
LFFVLLIMNMAGSEMLSITHTHDGARVHSLKLMIILDAAVTAVSSIAIKAVEDGRDC